MEKTLSDKELGEEHEQRQKRREGRIYAQWREFVSTT